MNRITFEIDDTLNEKIRIEATKNKKSIKQQMIEITNKYFENTANINIQNLLNVYQEQRNELEKKVTDKKSINEQISLLLDIVEIDGQIALLKILKGWK